MLYEMRMLYDIHTLGVLKIELTGSQLDQVEKTGAQGISRIVGQGRGAGDQQGKSMDRHQLCSFPATIRGSLVQISRRDTSEPTNGGHSDDFLLRVGPRSSCESCSHRPHITTTANRLAEHMATERKQTRSDSGQPHSLGLELTLSLKIHGTCWPRSKYRQAGKLRSAVLVV